MSSQYSELRRTNRRDPLAGFGHPSKFQQGSRLAFVTAATSLTAGQPNFARCLAVCWAGLLCIYFRGLLPHNRNLPGAKFTLRPSLAFSCSGYCTALEQWAWAKLCGIVQGMELWKVCSSSFSTHGATYILTAAITLGINPNSSSLWPRLMK